MARKRDKRWEEEDRQRKEYETKQRRRCFVTPECCQAVQDSAAVCLNISETFADGDLDTPPKWIVRTGEPYLSSFNVIEAHFCPFCATKLPGIEKRQTDRKIMVVTDGGYYCKTCEERCNCCNCLPAAFHWQAVGAVAIIPPSPKREEDDD